MAVEARAFADADADAWDALVSAGAASTLLQTRRFLSYHGDRFQDASVCVTDGDGRLVGVLPAAVDRAAEDRVVSHPGSTYGGLVHDGALRGEGMLEALGAVAAHLAGRGFQVLEYKPLPWIYQARPEQDDLYALFRLGAQRSRVDLSCAVDLQSEAKPSSRRRRGRKKAEKAGVVVRSGAEHAGQVWDVLEQTLAARHDARPVHSLDEIRLLAERFPHEIEFLVGAVEDTPVAGVVLFHSPRVSHAQYISSTPEGNQVGALDAVFGHAIEAAREAGRRFFDFGTSNRERGLVLNASLYEYKAQYGGGGVAYEAYELPLSGAGTSSSL